MRYIAFLRGINVGGIKVPMAELKDVFEGLGYEDIKTVLQTGNVAFTTADKPETTRRAIEQALSKAFGYKANVLIYTEVQVAAIIKGFPFAAKPDHHRYVMFTDPEVNAELLAAAKDVDSKVEQVKGGTGCIYWMVPRGQTLQSAYAKVQTKAKYKPHITVRNLNTLEKLAAS